MAKSRTEIKKLLNYYINQLLKSERITDRNRYRFFWSVDMDELRKLQIYDKKLIV